MLPPEALGDLAELRAEVALAGVRAPVSESMRMPVLSLGATSSSIACMIKGTPAITITRMDEVPSDLQIPPTAWDKRVR